MVVNTDIDISHKATSVINTDIDISRKATPALRLISISVLITDGYGQVCTS